MSREVFISYAQEDRGVAEGVCDVLEKAGVTCWIAPRDIPAAAMYPVAIAAGVRECRAMVLVFSEHSVQSHNVLQEVGLGFNGRKPIVPFRLGDVPAGHKLEYFLSLAQWVDGFPGEPSGHLPRLADAVGSTLQRRLSVPAPRTPPPGARLWLKRGGIAAAVVSILWAAPNVPKWLSSTGAPTGVVPDDSAGKGGGVGDSTAKGEGDVAGATISAAERPDPGGSTAGKDESGPAPNPPKRPVSGAFRPGLSPISTVELAGGTAEIPLRSVVVRIVHTADRAEVAREMRRRLTDSGATVELKEDPYVPSWQANRIVAFTWQESRANAVKRILGGLATLQVVAPAAPKTDSAIVIWLSGSSP